MIKVLVPMRHPVGGIRTYLKYTYKYLERRSYEFTLLAPYKDYLNQLKNDLAGLNVKVIYTRKEGSAISLFIALFKALFKYEYDIIHSQGFTAGIITVLANLFFQIPHLMTSHDVFRADLFHERFAFLQKKILEVLFSRIDLIQSVSYDAQNNLFQYLPWLRRNPTKTIVIKNGIDMDQFPPQAAQEEEQVIHRDNNEFIIGFVGRFMPQKGFTYLLNVADLLRKRMGSYQAFKIICVGGYGGFIREFKKEIEERRMTNYFQFIGFQENVHSVMRQFHVLVMPSLWEACPILPMEALVCGTPIVAFSCIGLREVLNSTPAIMVPVRGTKNMANEILRIMNDYENIKREFEDFVLDARERFDAKLTANKLDDLFSKYVLEKEKASNITV